MDHRPTGEGPTDGNHVVRIGDWLLDPSSRLLSRGGFEHRIEPKMCDVLLCLVQRRGQVVDRRDIERTVWSEAAVGSDLLNRTIWKLRQAMEDDSSDPRYIETIPRVGYRLISAVQESVGSLEDRPSPTGPGRGGVRWPHPGIGTAALAVIVLAASLLLWHSGSPWADRETGEVLISRPLTSDPGYEANPSASPSGRLVAFQRYDPNAVSPSWDVGLVDVESGRTVALASEPGVHEYAPTWAPTGDSVAFIRSGERCQIVKQALDGPPNVAAECQSDQWHEIAWLTGGTLVLASSAPGQSLGLDRLRVTGERQRMTAPPAGFDGDRMPRVSPDGRMLAFVRQRTEGVSDIYVLDLTPDSGTSQPRRITTDHRPIRGLAWDPRGSALLFSARRGGGTRVWKVPVRGGTPSPVALSGHNAGPLSTTEGLLVYEEYQGDSDLWIHDPRTGRVEPWYGSSRSEWGAAVSPDGHSVAFVSDQTGSDEIWLMSTRGREPRPMTSFDGAELDPPRWHPDGRRVVFASAAHGSFDVFTLDVETDALERLTHGDDDERRPAWWNGSVVYSANRTGTEEIWLLDRAAGRDQRLTSGGGSFPRPGPGGDLLFARPDEPGIWRLGQSDGAIERVGGTHDDEEGANWWPTEEGILLLRSTSGTRSELVLLGLTSEADSVLARVPLESTRRSGISRFPDGRLLFGIITQSESDLWIAR